MTKFLRSRSFSKRMGRGRLWIGLLVLTSAGGLTLGQPAAQSTAVAPPTGTGQKMVQTHKRPAPQVPTVDFQASERSNNVSRVSPTSVCS